MTYYPEGVNKSLRRQFASMEEIKQAIAQKNIYEGKVILCDREHNLHLDLGVIRGIIPRCEGAVGIADGTVRDIALISKVGRWVCYRIAGLHRNKYGQTVAILSRRIVQQECQRRYIDLLSVGDIINARVTHLERFGAFIDIGAGINSLIPIDMLSVSRISHPCQRVSNGDTVSVLLRSREEGKLTFSLKELLGTWQENADLFRVGETVTGVVRSVESYGVFVELMPNLAGLAELTDQVEIGQQVSVFIKSILPDKMKIKLVIVDAFGQEGAPQPPIYFEKGDHITHWVYSTPQSKKKIETHLNTLI